MPALLVNYVLGFGAVLAYALAARVSRPAVGKMAGAPWWAWLGGLAGAVYGVAAILLASRLGAATLMALVVTGQLLCSVLLDHFGWVGFEVHPAGWGRLAGAAYGVAAILLASRLGAATLMALVVTGQLLCSVLLDHFGWVGFEVHPAGWGRVIGCVLMAAGFALIARF